MEQNDDLEKLFANMYAPEPDSERKKAALNLAVSAFEAQKFAILKNNVKNRQGKSWLARLTSQITSERKDPMNTSNKRFLYGGLATACIALVVGSAYLTQNTYNNEAFTGLPVTYFEREQTLTVADAMAPQKNFEPVQEESLAIAQAPASVAPPMAAKRAMSADMSAENVVGGANLALPSMPSPVVENEGRDRFQHVEQNSIQQVNVSPVSTFSIDVDTSSYSFVRQSLDNGILPQKDAVRIEEMVNYFDYAYPLPKSKDEPFSTNIVVKDSPWNEGKKLLTIGIKGYDVEQSSRPDSNLVFLLDTSGSMEEPNKLPLLKQSMAMLVDSLKPTDKISIVVYAGSAGTILQPTEVSKKGEILQALNNLSAGGSTAGGEGIRMAYDLAKSNFKKNAVNRVFLATDGDFNVGISAPEELKGFVERERENGIFLSVLGFGTGNYNDALMQELAQNGNGVAAYIDTLNEARKVLVQEASATLFTIAKDVKIQVEFNPATVSEYRLVGYETRALKTEDFNNDKVDAGDIGAGAEVTAIYEVTPVGTTPAIDASRYSNKASVAASDDMGTEMAFVKVRYKLPNESTSKLIAAPVSFDQQADEVLQRETNWATAVAGFSQLLKGGIYTGALTYDDVLKLAEANKGNDPYGYRAEFINLVYKAKTAASMPAQPRPGGGEYQYR